MRSPSESDFRGTNALITGGNRANVRAFADRLAINVADVHDAPNLPGLLESQDVLFNLPGQTSHSGSRRSGCG